MEKTEYTMEHGDILIINSDVPYLFTSHDSICYIAINFDYTYSHFTHRFPITSSFSYKEFNKEKVLERIRFTDAPALNTVFYVRISKAANLLDTTSYSVTKIAEEVGFSLVNRFSNRFKKIAGTSPSLYRSAANA